MKKLIGGAARDPRGLMGKRESSLVESVGRAAIFSMGFLVLAVLVAAGAQVDPARADVSQTPVATACPAGYELLSVASLEAAGPYLAPRYFDTAGNNNGYVCGNALPFSVRDAHCRSGGGNSCNLAQLGLPIYLFIDDQNPASNATSG